MSFLYYVIAFFISSYCFYKAKQNFDMFEDEIWSFIWNVTGFAIIVSMFRL